PRRPRRRRRRAARGARIRRGSRHRARGRVVRRRRPLRSRRRRMARRIRSRRHAARGADPIRGDRMTTRIERSWSKRPVTWVTLIGLLALPALIGGILVAALHQPTERLENMTAAIVNDDEGVEIDGQLAPLGRQLAAGLVEGSDDADSNITWVISNADDASEGVDDGTYQAVVTIPEDFSEAAMSSANAIQGSETPTSATIDVETSTEARIFDGAI